jgi:hypothetical protein
VPEIEATVSTTERHRTIKVFRALWKKMAAMNYCEKDADSSLTFSNTAPPRQELWSHREVMKLVQRAWRKNKKGLPRSTSSRYAASMRRERSDASSFGKNRNRPKVSQRRSAKCHNAALTRANLLIEMAERRGSNPRPWA